MPTRRLRPQHIVPTGEDVWLVDAHRPAAAIVAADGTVRHVHWQETGPPPAAWEGRTIVPDGTGVVTQVGSVLTWVHADGSTRTAESELDLAAADAQFAWCVDAGQPNYQLFGEWADDPDTHDETGRLVALSHDGARHLFEAAQPVAGVQLDGDEVIVVLAEQPFLHPNGRMEYPTSLLRLTRSDLFTHGLVGVPVRQPSRRVADDDDDDDDDDGGDDRWTWLETSADRVVRNGERAGGLIWWVGNDPQGDKINRTVTVLGHDPDTGSVVVRIDAGAGMVTTAQAVGDEFWVGIARERFHRVSRSRGVEVVAFTPGGQRTVLMPDSVDISMTDPPLVPRPSDAQIEQYVAEIRRDLEALDTPSRPEHERRFPPSFRDVSVSNAGEWPFNTVTVTFRHRARPGLLLRRSFGVFDQRGRPLGHLSCADDLDEDMSSGYVSPADEAVDGVLDT